MIPHVLSREPELTTAPDAMAAPAHPLLPRLRQLAQGSLPQMYDRDAQRYVFTVRRGKRGLVPAGVSDRYTAIALIGLAADGFDRWSLPYDPVDLVTRMIATLPDNETLGDAALIAWAARAVGGDSAAAWTHVDRLFTSRSTHPTVEAAWALAAAAMSGGAVSLPLQKSLAAFVLKAWNPRAGLFGHGDARGARSHVACFADQVYPIFALSRFAAAHADLPALDAAVQCARRICALQGTDGQWWWHYDHRTGAVIEGYPVYAIHQDAMAPMALRAVADASGESFADHIRRGVQWLEASPELHGGTLLDMPARMLWRKVARREPMKATRYMQAVCTRLHPRLRTPGVDVLFPAAAIDYEDRPYHWGWFLYAWAERQDPQPARRR
jgi:hypothetical protein